MYKLVTHDCLPFHCMKRIFFPAYTVGFVILSHVFVLFSSGFFKSVILRFVITVDCKYSFTVNIVPDRIFRKFLHIVGYCDSNEVLGHLQNLLCEDTCYTNYTALPTFVGKNWDHWGVKFAQPQPRSKSLWSHSPLMYLRFLSTRCNVMVM